MRVFRGIPVWLVLACYLFANTLASSLHDHRDCSHNHVPCHSAECATVGLDHEHGHPDCRNHGACRIPATEHEDNGDAAHDRQHCVVCDFLTLAPLAAPRAVLELAGEVLPRFVDLDVLSVPDTTVESHLARGPPAA